MNNKFKIILGIALFACFLVLAAVSYSALSQKYRPETGMDSGSQREGSSESEQEKYQAPDFTVFDADGNPVKLSDFKGKPVVLNFWASWCGPCQREMPHFNKAYAKYKDEIVFMMVDLVDGQRETQSKGSSFIKNQGYDFPVYFDIEEDAAYTYGITSIPMTLFIDRDGYIKTGYAGAIDEETLQAAIELIDQ
ncbi:MAG TPA: TlpA disulfide reductase family protein [Candidatus Avimonas sp.]|nr:TlpA family protein disulfide reductase [Clostridiales bacterium]HPU58080.1 TlpA disulfide reductase family protein [Candidatus Avimonas sp.]